LASGPTKGSVTFEVEEGRELQVDLRVVEEESFGAAWQYFTGSKEHNVRLRERAVARKWRLNEYGLYDGEKRLVGKDEEGIYKKLGLPWIPPELREDCGEFEREASSLELVNLDDVRGDLHMHTTASDGRNTIEEMALAAKARGYQYIAICDHSKSAVIANGLSIDRMKDHVAAIRAADQKIKGITILAGCECDILGDGSLDYPDEILALCDWVVASIHSGLGPGTGKHGPTQRTLNAMRNRYVSALGHPTGRLINRRAAMELDMAAVSAEAVRTGTFLEINASWQRLDLKDVHVRQALDAGALLTINTDSHHVDQLEGMRLGILTARRGGASRKDIVNCLTLAALRKQIAAKREK
jgi:DNA polymerase (family 10)